MYFERAKEEEQMCILVILYTNIVRDLLSFEKALENTVKTNPTGRETRCAVIRK